MLVDKYPKDLTEVINDLQNYVNPKVCGCGTPKRFA
jgi:hypothetical protein